MILKFQLNMKLTPDHNISVSSEQITDSAGEADAAGAKFAELWQAFSEGYVRRNAELQDE